MQIAEYLAMVEDAAIAQIHPFAGYSLVELLNMWNEATAPYVPRTESEHDECSHVARTVKMEISRRFVYGRDYKELSNGSLWAASNA